MHYVKKLGIKNFRGVFMSDTLPTKPKPMECGIVNFDIDENMGTHWICYWKQYHKACVFDSFGTPIPPSLVKYLSGGGVSITYMDCTTSDTLQTSFQVICGHLCLTVLKLFSDGYSYFTIKSMLDRNPDIWRNYVV